MLCFRLFFEEDRGLTGTGSDRLQVRSNYGGPIDTFLHVLREEGWTSLYAGLAPALIGNAYAQGAALVAMIVSGYSAVC